MSFNVPTGRFADYLTDGLTTGRKLERIKEICTILARKHGLVNANLHEKLKNEIGRATVIIDERNTIIHGQLVARRGDRPVFGLRMKTVEMTSEALTALMQRIDQAVDRLGTAYMDFMGALHDAQQNAHKR